VKELYWVQKKERKSGHANAKLTGWDGGKGPSQKKLWAGVTNASKKRQMGKLLGQRRVEGVEECKGG